jgi:hypothetical protein
MRAIFVGQVEGGLQPLTAREPRHRGRRSRRGVDASVQVRATVLAGGRPRSRRTSGRTRGVIRGVKRRPTPRNRADRHGPLISLYKLESALHWDRRDVRATLHTREVAGSKPAVPMSEPSDQAKVRAGSKPVANLPPAPQRNVPGTAHRRDFGLRALGAGEQPRPAPVELEADLATGMDPQRPTVSSGIVTACLLRRRRPRP